MNTNEFAALNLHQDLVLTLTELGYENPTPIQSAVIPVMLDGCDVIGQAQTGTGKTAAFSLPILQDLTPAKGYVQGLVLAPTRELAIQVAKAMGEYGRRTGSRIISIYGGEPYSRQLGQLKKGVDIVVGTPGRILDLVEKKALDLSRVSTVVLDEADEMLSMGFIEDIQSILDNTPPSRRTSLFSATLPKGIRHLAKRYMKDPRVITIDNRQLTVAAIEQRYYMINERDKLAALTRLFEVENMTSALIFARTRQGTTELADKLVAMGFGAEALNGDLTQDKRIRVLERFRGNQTRILVATDVAARGLDIEDISHVYNYDLPLDPEVFVHRVGRTGRAGREGTAISLVTPKELFRLERIETYTRQKISRADLPTEEDIVAQRDARLVGSLNVWLKRARCRRERKIVTDLAELGHDPIEIAAAALRLARAEEKQRPIVPVGKVIEKNARTRGRTERPGGKRKGRRGSSSSEEGGMIRLSLSTGRDDGVCANHVVGTLARYAHIPGHSIGKISIEKRHTLVDIPEEFAGRVLSLGAKYRIGKHSVTVARA